MVPRQYNKMDLRLLAATFLVLLTGIVAEDEIAEDGHCSNDDECGTDSIASPGLKYKGSYGYREPLGITVKAYFAMACFWGVEATFGCQPGVVRVRAGYMGGEKDKPTYKDLGDHTETVEVEYDPYKTTYSNLLKSFWEYHDYTAEYKTQYMSALFYVDDEQQLLAGKGKTERETKGETVATKILQAKIFYRAEDYHQKYFLRQHDKIISDLGISDIDLMESSLTSRLLCYLAGPGEEEDFLNEAESLGLNDELIEYVREQMKTKIFEGCAP